MKKQFIYAALCIALMSSCSKDNDPGNISEPTTNTPDVIDEGSPVAIELGVGAPQVSVSTRGTGAAGTDDESGVALWDEQELKILMTKKNSLVSAKEDPNDPDSPYIFEGLTFNAPPSTATTVDQMKITNTTGAVKYYPLQGAYDFYGFSFDDAVVEGGFKYPEKGEADKTIEYNLTIDGTQDIMIAKAELTDAQKGDTSGDGKLEEADYAKAFSSWAARRGVQPTMNFKHLLSRLDFVAKVGANVDGGNEITITDDAYATKWPADQGYPQPEEGKIENGVYIKSIKVLNPKSKITVRIADLNTSGETGITVSAEDESIPSFTLMRKPTSDEIEKNQSKNLVELTPVTPGSVLDNKLSIGNGIMIVPGENSFQMEIKLMQYVMEHDGSAAPDYPQSYTWKESTLQTTVKLNAEEPSKVFEAGNYYTITTTIFGFQDIEVTATLSKWENGGDISTNPEDDAFNQ